MESRILKRSWSANDSSRVAASRSRCRGSTSARGLTHIRSRAAARSCPQVSRSEPQRKSGSVGYLTAASDRPFALHYLLPTAYARFDCAAALVAAPSRGPTVIGNSSGAPRMRRATRAASSDRCARRHNDAASMAIAPNVTRFSGDTCASACSASSAACSKSCRADASSPRRSADCAAAASFLLRCWWSIQVTRVLLAKTVLFWIGSCQRYGRVTIVSRRILSELGLQGVSSRYHLLAPNPISLA
jgi:hypothetical protein